MSRSRLLALLHEADRAARAVAPSARTARSLSSLQPVENPFRREPRQPSREDRERGIVDVETLKKVNRDMIDTLDAVIKISEEGSRKRAEAVKELAQVQEDLNSKIIGTFGKSKQIEIE